MNYIVGDIHGCFDELQQLLDKVNFNLTSDTLWLVGDLVARGEQSLETLRFIRDLGSSAKAVLGNHDLHLLAVSEGIKPKKEKDKTMPIFEAEDRDALFAWLRQLPLLDEHDEFVITHAGISPQWDLDTARQCAREVESILQSPDYYWLLENMYRNTPELWSPELEGLERYCYTINAYTRMRFCFPNGGLDMACKLPPTETDPSQLMPWFQLDKRIKLDKTVLFGHWAALQGHSDEQVIGLDTGCVWGGHLTMLRWEDRAYFTQASLVQS